MKGVCPYPQKYFQQQLDVLLLMCPGPIGLGMTEKMAGAILGITDRGVRYRLASFKKRFPSAYAEFQSMRRSMFRQGHNLMELVYLVLQATGEGEIIEKF